MQLGPLLFCLLTIALLFASYIRHSIYDAHDPYKCGAALNNGTWLDPPTTSRPVLSSFSKWQPDGCTIEPFSETKVENCLGPETERENVFIGDSTLREIFWAMARRLDKKAALEASNNAEKHSDLSFRKDKTAIKFVWDPLLNSSDIGTHISRIRSKAQDTGGSSNNGLVVLGGGLWFTRETTQPIDDFKDTMDAITDHIPMPDLDSKGAHRPLILPVQPPHYDSLDQDHRIFMKPELIDSMNNYMRDLSMEHDIDVPTSYLHMYEGLPATAYEPTGRHLIHSISDKQAELILNVKCNDEQSQYPYSATCCLEYRMNWMQLTIWAVGIAVALAVAWVELQVWTGAEVSGVFEKVEAHLSTLRSVLIMLACLYCCYLTDRTHIFNKVLKLYNSQDFWMFCAAFALTGFSSISRSGSPFRPTQDKVERSDQPFLSRDQTDEWKGWMQALILAYHYVGGSKVLWIYRIVRLLVASYLFMTGYGHAAYFYQRNDYSFKRVIAVLIRLNLLSCLLPWMMDTDYLFYYFAPLVTYWYIVIYITFRAQSEWNKNLTFLLSKVCVASMITTVLHLQHWLFDPPMRLINFIFRSQWEAEEWLFRVSLDQYVVYIGMVVAVLYIRSTRPLSPVVYPQSKFSAKSHTRSSHSSPYLKTSLSFAASVAALVVYQLLANTRKSKESSNQLHPYISPLPILAFVYLRNCTSRLRNHHSAAFAWLGRISLETFVLQYHLWLAADTKGLLSLGILGDGGMGTISHFPGLPLLGPGMGLARWTDCILLGVVFIWVSFKVSAATGAITAVAAKALFR